MEKKKKKAKLSFTGENEEISHHLWGIRKPYKSNDCKAVVSFFTKPTWQYIKECSGDRRALRGIDVRIYSQLEIRSNEDGKTIKVFTEDDGWTV